MIGKYNPVEKSNIEIKYLNRGEKETKEFKISAQPLGQTVRTGAHLAHKLN